MSFLTFPYGTGLTVSDSNYSVILTQAKGNFRVSSDEGNLGFIGYERVVITEGDLLFRSQLTTLGEGYFQGPHPIKLYRMKANLKDLTSQEMEDLISMHESQLKSEDNVLLLDELIIEQEALPRTRAKVGTVNPPGSPSNTATTEYFWAQFYVELIARRQNFTFQRIDKQSGDALWLGEIEMLTLGKVPITEDLA